MPTKSLYFSCLKAISILLIKRLWISRQGNPFQFLPSEVLHDLVTTTLRLQTRENFRSSSLKLLLTSGNIRQFKMHSRYRVDELVLTFQSLSTACQNLEVLELTEIYHLRYTDAPKALTELVKNLPNLKYIHSEVSFDLVALRNCKKLQTVMLHFIPHQRLCDFLEEEQGILQSLDTLELFTICLIDYTFEELITVLQKCPALISLGSLNTSSVLSQLHRTGVLSRVKLRCCCWGKFLDYDSESEWIRDAIEYHPFVEELDITIRFKENLADLSRLRCLVFLRIVISIREDVNVLFRDVLKAIGHQLKYLHLTLLGDKCSEDVIKSLQSCVNLEVLALNCSKLNQFAKLSISLPNLKCLHIFSCDTNQGPLISVFTDCNNLVKLAFGGADDDSMDQFLRNNSLSNLKAASLIFCTMTKPGFKKFFLKASNLEIIEASTFLIRNSPVESAVKKALLETNHKALFNHDQYRKNNFGILDQFIFKKRECYLSVS